MSTKRQSLNEKCSHTTLERSASDSNVNYTPHNKFTSADKNSPGLDFADSPDKILDWVHRRSEANRRPPKPVSQFREEQDDHYISQLITELAPFELDAGPAVPHYKDELLAHASEGNQRNDDLAVPKIKKNDKDREFKPPRRTNTGTDEIELAKVLSLSLLIK